MLSKEHCLAFMLPINQELTYSDTYVLCEPGGIANMINTVNLIRFNKDTSKTMSILL